MGKVNLAVGAAYDVFDFTLGRVLSRVASASRPDKKLLIRSDVTRGRLNTRLFMLVFAVAMLVVALASLLTWHVPGNVWVLALVAALFARNIGKLQCDGPERIAVYGIVFAVLLFVATIYDNLLPTAAEGSRSAIFMGLAGVAVFGDRLLVRHKAYSRVSRWLSLSCFSGASTQRLQDMKDSIDDGLNRLSRLRVFDVGDGALIRAWEANSSAQIQELLKKGAHRNGDSSALMIGILNEVGDRIDLARGHLARIIRRSDRYLRPYQIDEHDPRVRRSLVVSGMPQVIVSRQTLPRPLNISNGVNQAVLNISRSNLSVGQGAAALLVTLAVAVVAHGVHNSRALRKLKELEGQLTEQAEAISGEIQTCITLVQTQMRPQFQALADYAYLIEGCVSELRAADPTGAGVAMPPHAAFQLKIALLEARRLLETKAGDG